VQRVSVVGNAGSGKTTLATAVAQGLGVPLLELDSVFHQPGWRPRPTSEFRADVARFTAQPQWVVDGNYSIVQDIVWSRADTVVWLDLPRCRVMRQVVARTVTRLVRRTELWNGNREQWSNLFSRDPERSVIAWAWTQHDRYRARYGAAQADPANAHLTFVRVRSPADRQRLVTAATSCRRCSG
jgi:adenylate kinase family enzyme